jgi:hypothetical protein
LEKADISNYRPISTVTGFVKILETLIFKRLNDHIVTHKIIPTAVWIPERTTTEDAIYKLTNVIQL